MEMNSAVKGGGLQVGCGAHAAWSSCVQYQREQEGILTDCKSWNINTFEGFVSEKYH